MLFVESQAAFTQAFSPPPSRRQSTNPQAQLNIETGKSSSTDQGQEESAVVLQEEPSSSSSSDDSWKTEYEAQVESWRAQSSEAREKAEKERKRWEELRASEREEAARQNAAVAVVVKEEHEAGWETVSNSQKTESTVVSGLHAPSPADSRDLVTGESERQVRKSAFVHCLC
jgi:hypothetical protein